nr:P-loop NTPase fold protein [uncultured Hyphomonas sp.]
MEKNNKSWFTCNKDAENILDQIKNGKTNHLKPRVSLIFIIISLLLLAFPTIVNLFIQGITNGAVSPNNVNASPIPNWYVIAGIVEFSLLFIFIFTAYIFSKNDLFQVVVSRKLVDNKYDISSVDYDKWFTEVLSDTLRNERKLVIVIDNLDRLLPEKRLLFISTLQTFLQYLNGSDQGISKKLAKHLWVLLPYNETILRDNKVPPFIDEKELLDKRIQLKLTVPELLTSNWEDFFKIKFKQSFKNHQDNDTIENIIILMKEILYNNPPHPRQIISLINDIGALHSQWCPEIPISHISYYVLINKFADLKIDQLSLLNNDYPRPYASRLLDNDSITLKESLICLFFNATIEEARQLLINRPLQKALTDGDYSSFEKIISNNQTSVHAHIDVVLSELSKEPQYIDRIYKILHTLNHNETINTFFKDKRSFIRRCLRDMIYQSRKEEILTKENCEEANYLIRFFKGEAKVIEEIIEIINPKSISSLEKEKSLKDKDYLDIDLQSVITGFESLIQTLRDNYPNKKPIQITIRTGEERFFDFLQGIYQHSALNNVDHIKYIPLEGPNSSPNFESITTLVNYKDKLITTSFLGALKLLDQLSLEYNKSVLNKNISNKLISYLETEYLDQKLLESSNALLETILYLDSVEGNHLSQFISLLSPRKSGLVIRIIEKTIENKNYQTAAIWLYIQLRAFPQEISFPPSNIKEFEPLFLENICKKNQNELNSVLNELQAMFHKNIFSESSLWFANIQANLKNAPLLYEILINFSTLKRNTFDIEADWVYSNWKIFNDSLTYDQYKSFILELIGSYDLEAKVLNKINLDQSRFIAQIILFGKKKTFASDLVKNHLRLIDETQWDTFFEGQHDIFRILYQLSQLKNFTIALDDPFINSYILFAKKYINNLIKPALPIDQLSSLYKAIDGRRLPTIRREIFDLVEDQHGNLPQDFFSIFGEFLIDENALNARHHKFVNIFTPLIKKQNETHLQWVITVLSSPGFIKTISNNEIDEIKDFQATTMSILNNDNISEEVKKSLEEIITLLHYLDF